MSTKTSLDIFQNDSYKQKQEKFEFEAGINEVQEDSNLWLGFNVPYLKSITTKDLENRKNTMDLTFQRPIIGIILDKLLNGLELPTL